MLRFIVILAFVLIGVHPLPAQSPGAGSQAAPEMVHIDGAKNPELIPQWSAWAYAFRVIAGGSRELPSEVYEAVSGEERRMVLAESDAAKAFEEECRGRLGKLRPRVGRERHEVIEARLREITRECRIHTLDTRDRVLLALNPRGAAALSSFVESTKAGTTVTIRKADLAWFLSPE